MADKNSEGNNQPENSGSKTSKVIVKESRPKQKTDKEIKTHAKRVVSASKEISNEEVKVPTPRASASTSNDTSNGGNVDLLGQILQKMEQMQKQINENSKRPLEVDEDDLLALSDEESLDMDLEVDNLLTNTEIHSETEGNIILEKISQELIDEEATSPSMMPELAEILNRITSKRISDEKIKEKLEKFPPPANLSGLKVPKVNTEVWNKILPATRGKDIRLQKAQTRVVRALTPLAQLANMFLEAKNKKESFDIPAGLSLVLNAFSFVANGSIEISLRRRELIKPDLHREYRDVCSPDTPITEWLFGDDFAGVVKGINETNKVATKVGSRKDYYGRNRPAYRPRGFQKYTPSKNGYRNFKKSRPNHAGKPKRD
ncbi:uncharacterized protein LOC112042656 [Lingula anatina]|uniref:Uncharacterized protein LOC112042656 n=1 Tax=Lingula anatina TaxID=7574 RepID=A0A2R2MSQ8_LINAN|nr:uncharacterized protein LOC112042656 [Lingula anatina]|eukprot:XP_023933296.1 uncharacterized protein LOC112042656 [Lingula anatina]